jgi:hypothetical protein
VVTVAAVVTVAMVTPVMVTVAMVTNVTAVHQLLSCPVGYQLWFDCILHCKNESLCCVKKILSVFSTERCARIGCDCSSVNACVLFFFLLGPISVNAPVCTTAFESYCAALNTKFSPDSTALCLL